MRRQLRLVEIQRRRFGAGDARQKPRQRARDRVGLGLRMRLRESAGEIRRRHVVAAQRFRQRADQFGGFLFHQARHQPTQSCGIERLEQVQGNIEGDAIVGRARFETVMQREARVAEREIFRKTIGLAALARQQIGERPFQVLLLFRRQLAVPAVQALRAVEIGREAIEIPARLPVLIGDQSGAAPFRLFLARFRQGREVSREEGRARIDLARQQGLAHENLARFRRIQTAVVHRFLRRQHQTEQADLLRADHPALRPRPMRIEMLARQQMRQLGDHPIRFDARRHQAPDFLRVEHRRHQQPRWRLFRQG